MNPSATALVWVQRSARDLVARDGEWRRSSLARPDGLLFDVLLVDLVLGDFVRGGGGSRADAEEEAEVEVPELALELADDAARVAEEGGGEGEDGAGVARVGLETPDRGTERWEGIGGWSALSRRGGSGRGLC